MVRQISRNRSGSGSVPADFCPVENSAGLILAAGIGQDLPDRLQD
jgi:hypothetical protein